MKIGTLPSEITRLVVAKVSDACDERDPDLAGSIDDLMEKHFEQMIEVLVEKFGLTEEQQIELKERLCWSVSLINADFPSATSDGDETTKLED